MADEVEAAEGLSAEEQAFFDSKGESGLPEPKPVEGTPAEAAETGEEPAAGAEDEHKGPKLVPLAALTKERAEAKEIKEALRKVQEQNAVLADRWNTILQMQKQPQAPEQQAPQAPDPETDLFGHLKWMQDQIVAAQKADAEARALTEQQQKAAHVEQAVWNHWHADAANYAKTNTDFPNAAKWLSEFREKQLAALSVVDKRFSSPQARANQINAELRQIVVGAAQEGRSPAEIIYELATGYGYAPQAPASKQPDPAKMVEALAAGIEGSTTLSGGGGSKPNAAVSPEDIAKMSEDEFARWLDKAGEKGFRRMAGG